MRKAFWGPPQFPGQEEINCWTVCYTDGLGQDDSWDDFMAALKDPEVKLRIVGSDLTLVEAATLVAELADDDPEMRCVVLPIRLGKPT